MSDLSREIYSLWLDAFTLAAESKSHPLDSEDLQWIDEVILLLKGTQERARDVA